MKVLTLLFLALGLAAADPNHRSRYRHRHRTSYRGHRWGSGSAPSPADPTDQADSPAESPADYPVTPTAAAPAGPTFTATPAPAGNATTSGNSILIPLYSYPHNGAWDPLFQAADNHPGTNFIVIVNPDNGPMAAPDAAFTEAVQKVAAYANIQAIGYIATGYGGRSASDIVKDVNTYASWASQNAPLDGVFFDETVAVYSSEAASTYHTMNQAVKDAAGLGLRTVVHNPGTVPADALENPMTDITVVFESPYDSYHQSSEGVSKLSGHRSSYSIMVYAVSSDVDIATYTSSLSESAQYLFVTDLSTNYYSEFSPNWTKFVGAVSS